METLHQFSNDSFSYSWLININPSSFDMLDDAIGGFSIDTADGGPFIEMDPRLASLRRMSVDAHDFDFGLSGSQSPVLVHADQIFSNGLILPLHLVTPPTRVEASTTRSYSDSSESLLSRSLSLGSSRVLLCSSNRHKSPYFYAVPSRPISSNSAPPALAPGPSPSKSGLKLPFVRSCGRTSKKILQKYLCFLVPLYKKVKGLGLIGARAAVSPTTASSARSCCAQSTGSTTSPRTRNGLSSVDWCRVDGRTFDTGVEKSIHDAVLHCKKSIGRDE